MRYTNLLLLLVTAIACEPQYDTTQTEAFLFKEINAQLGEGAIWNHETRTFWWIDIEGKRFFIMDPASGQQVEYSLEQRIGTIVPTISGGAVVALEDGIYLYDLGRRSMELLSAPEDTIPEIRFNDGKCDPAGRLWVGSMGMKQRPYRASLYRVEPNGATMQMVDSVTISNGICWSLDERTMYYIDTPTRQVRAYDYNKASGAISNERVIIEVPESVGYPDGMVIDAEGMLWVALWNGNKVGRWNPATGEMIGSVTVPAHNITSCAFGGANLDTLFITTASIDMSPEEKEAMPLSGSVFAAVPGVKGVESSFFKR